MARKKKKFLKGERLLQFLIALLIFGNIFGSSFSMALLSKTNIEVESMKKKISKQNDLNEVAGAQGLEYNNSNIVVVN